MKLQFRYATLFIMSFLRKGPAFCSIGNLTPEFFTFCDPFEQPRCRMGKGLVGPTSIGPGLPRAWEAGVPEFGLHPPLLLRHILYIQESQGSEDYRVLWVGSSRRARV